MQLSNIETRNKNRYGIVYHTGHKLGDEAEVELLTERTFETYEGARGWMRENVDLSRWLGPTIVKIEMRFDNVKSL